MKQAKPHKQLNAEKTANVSLNKVRSFFDHNFINTSYFHALLERNKQRNKQRENRRNFLKSAVGATGIGLATGFSTSALAKNALSQNSVAADNSQALLNTDPWLTLDTVLNHLLPESPVSSPDSGPSANDIQATQYLINVVHQQPTDADEINFIYQGVGWLNDFSKSQHQRVFTQLPTQKKESLLKAISRSRAGENWLNNLINYIYEAMLSAPSYGGNPQGIGWQWLDHQPGYPLPPVGKRYFELPGKHRIVIKQASTNTASSIASAANNDVSNKHYQNGKKA